MIKKYNQFLKENSSINFDNLLKSIDAKIVLMGDVLDFNSENFDDIDILSKDSNFLEKLDKKNYKKNNIENTIYCETFLEKSHELKFFLIFNKGESELDPTPEYIVIQTERGPIKMYEINNNIRNFYDKLSSKTIEIKRGNKNYIFKTSNAGNDWTLQNIQNKDNDFKTIMNNDEIKSQLKQNNTSIITIS